MTSHLRTLLQVSESQGVVTSRGRKMAQFHKDSFSVSQKPPLDARLKEVQIYPHHLRCFNMIGYTETVSIPFLKLYQMKSYQVDSTLRSIQYIPRVSFNMVGLQN